MLPAHRLSIADRDFLESVVSMDEIKAAVYDCGSQKALGPDGYSFMFIKKFLNLLKHDIQSFVVRFFSTDYRLISLIGIHYKIVAKILANRLSKVIDSIINPEKYAFITWRGLSQGDPLSPFLFIIVMEGLHMDLNDGLAANMFHGVTDGSPGMYLSHLFYTNDVIILSEWNLNAMENIIRIINIFYISSGLKINIHKSNVYGVRVSSNEVEIMASYTGCEAGFFPFTYLGLPIGSNMSRIINCQPLIDRFKARLLGRKANLLSIGGRLTLIKFVLSSLVEWRIFHNLNALCVYVVKAIHGDEASIDIRGCQNNGVWASTVGRPVKMGRTKAEFDARISNIVNLEPEELVDSDTCIWSLSHDDKFSVNSVRKHIDELPFPFLSPSTQWCKIIPKKVNIFMWQMFLDRLANRLNLYSRGPDIDLIMCPVCNVSMESSAHTFFSCDTASAVWHLVRVWSCSMFPSFSSCGEWDLWFQSWHISKEKKDHAYVIFAASC
ncbi:RNA-directed DNA polymerase, eukaryota, reverse transcriptase zinc-binding domain protein [Tanacetum coccineum]